MKIVFNQLVFLLIPFLVNSSEESTNSWFLKDPKEKEVQCSGFCHHLVEPLLNYIVSARSKEEQFSELQSKIREQELTIANKELLLTKQIELTAAYKSNIASKDALITNLQSQIKLKESQSDEKDKQIESLQSQLKNNELNIIEKNEEVLKLKSVINNKDVEISNLNSTVAEQFAELQGKIRDQATNIASLKETTASKDVLIDNLQTQIKSKESQGDEKDKQIGSLKSQLKNKESNITEKAGEVVKLKSVIKDKDVQIAKLNSTNAEQFVELQGKIRDQATNIASLKETTASKDVLIANLQSEKDKQIDKLQKDSELKINQLESRLAECKANSLPASCLGKSTDLHWIKIPDIAPFSVPCDSKLGGGGWTVIQRRMDDSVDFDRNWEEYKEGFGDLRGEFFLGLEKLHLLTNSQPHELYIHMEDDKNESSYEKYSHFVIGNETEAYEIKMLGERYGDAGDAMKYLLNMKFSTKDRDNDKWKNVNCAAWYESGWWFNDCGECNLNGHYGIGLYWYTWNYKLIKSTQMMIRPTRA